MGVRLPQWRCSQPKTHGGNSHGRRSNPPAQYRNSRLIHGGGHPRARSGQPVADLKDRQRPALASWSCTHGDTQPSGRIARAALTLHSADTTCSYVNAHGAQITLFTVKLNVSYLDRNPYENFALAVARHPSETDTHIRLRVAAFATPLSARRRSTRPAGRVYGVRPRTPTIFDHIQANRRQARSGDATQDTHR